MPHLSPPASSGILLLAKQHTLALFLLLLSFLLSVFYFPWLTGHAEFYWPDPSYFFEPLCRYIGEQLTTGHFPLWNPLAGLGESQLAIVSPGLFYPPNWLFALLPYSQAVALLQILHQLAAGAGGYLLCQRLSWGRLAGIVCGSVLALNSYMFSAVQNWTLVATACWAPLCLYSLLELSNRTTPLPKAVIPGATVLLALLILGGRPEIWGVALPILALTPLLMLADAKIQPLRLPARFALHIVAFTSGILLAMPGILPAAEWASLSYRTVRNVSSTLYFSANWYDISTLAIAAPFGNTLAWVNKFKPLYCADTRQLPFIASSFIGPICLTLVLLAIQDKTWRRRWSIIALLVVAQVIACGKNTPIMPFLINHLPILHFLRYPIKLMFFVEWSLAIIAARGAYMVASQNPALRKYLISTGLTWLLILVVAALAIAFPNGEWFGLHNAWQILTDDATATLAIKGMGASTCLCAAGGLATTALLALSSRQRHLAFLSLVCLLTGSLLAFPLNFLHDTSENGLYKARSFTADVIDRQNNQGIARIMPVIRDAPSLPSQYHAPDSAQAARDVALFSRQLLLYNTPIDFKIGTLDPYEGSLVRELFTLNLAVKRRSSQFAGAHPSDVPLSRACRASSTQYVVTEIFSHGTAMPMLDESSFQLLTEEPALNLRIFRTKDIVPFAYFVDRWQWLPSNGHSLWQLASASKEAFNPSSTVLLTGSGANALESSSKLQAVNFHWSSPEDIELDVDAPAKGLIVVTDSNYPGWKAAVDGKPATIFTANGLFKAVFVEAGKHNIQFLFKPDILTVALLLCGFGALLCLTCTALSARIIKS